MKNFLFLILLFSSCAVVVRPTGGDKDEIPPVALQSIPDSASTLFNEQEIRIYFDEYFEIKEANNIIISPPPKEKPKIDVVNKYLRIKFKEPLQPNTTYSINLVSAIHDINEKNVLPNYNLTFSTGNEIDTGIIQGKALFNFTGKPAANFTVALFHPNYQEYADTLIYPLFINKIDESGNFIINGIKPDQYYSLYAFEDINNNKKVDFGEKMGFITDSISSNDTNIIQIAENKLITPIAYYSPIEIDARTFKIPFKAAPHQKPYILAAHPSFDKSQQLYYSKLTHDTLIVLDYIKSLNDTLLSYYLYSDTFVVDTIQVKFKSHSYLYPVTLSTKNTLAPQSTIQIQSQQPIRNINRTQLHIYKNDSIPVDYQIDYDLFSIQINMEIEEKAYYKIQFDPKALTFMDGASNDSITLDFVSKEANAFGDLAVLFGNTTHDSIRIELLTDLEKDPVYSFSTRSDSVYFTQILAGNYHVRLIQIIPNQYPNQLIPFKVQPSFVYIHPTQANIRGGWIVGDFRLNNSQQTPVENED